MLKVITATTTLVMVLTSFLETILKIEKKDHYLNVDVIQEDQHGYYSHYDSS
jgi:hypothetical protein